MYLLRLHVSHDLFQTPYPHILILYSHIPISSYPHIFSHVFTSSPEYFIYSPIASLGLLLPPSSAGTKTTSLRGKIRQ